MDFKTYLSKHRDTRKIKEIMLETVKGVKQLHDLAFVHRDLTPANVVVTFERPIKVALINFRRSLPRRNISKSGERGTPGYSPDEVDLVDGDIRWDIYSLVVMLVECELGPIMFEKVISS